MAALKKSVERRMVSLTVIGRDRTGVIAGFTNLLFKLGANIEALEEEVRHGQFSMILQASWPVLKFDEAAARTALRKQATELSMEITFRLLSQRKVQRMAIFVTREPHCFQALLKAKLNCEISLVIANRPDLRPLAEKAGLPFVYLSWEDRIKVRKQLESLLERYEIDFIVLARFMRILSPEFVWRWKNKIINIHPSLLPSFQGASAYRQAFEKGVRVVGVTAHIVTPDLDEGPILEQAAFQITPDWTVPEIVKKGQSLESKVLVAAIRQFLQHRYDIYWGKVHSGGEI